VTCSSRQVAATATAATVPVIGGEWENISKRQLLAGCLLYCVTVKTIPTLPNVPSTHRRPLQPLPLSRPHPPLHHMPLPLPLAAALPLPLPQPRVATSVRRGTPRAARAHGRAPQPAAAGPWQVAGGRWHIRLGRGLRSFGGNRQASAGEKCIANSHPAYSKLRITKSQNICKF
jgi:hypothetical protein